MLNPILNFTNAELLPIGGAQAALLASTRFQANQLLRSGQLVAVNTGANANATQTFTTTGTGTAGTWRITFSNGEYVDLAYNTTAAAMQAALRNLAFFGQAGCTVSFSGATSAVNGNVATLTYTGPLGNNPQSLPTITLSLTGATIAVAAGTTGNNNGALIPYDGTVVAPPVAPTVAGNGAGSTFGAGTYNVSVTFVTAQGETTPSPATNVTVTANQNLRVTAYSSVNSAITAARFYVNGVFAAETAVSGGNIPQTDIAGVSATSRQYPTVNTAFTKANGDYKPVGALRFDTYANPRGFVTYGTSNSPQGIGTNREATYWTSGKLPTDNLIGLDQNAVTQMGGRFIKGSLGVAGSVLLIPA